jgi:hypothetical protein
VDDPFGGVLAAQQADLDRRAALGAERARDVDEQALPGRRNRQRGIIAAGVAQHRQAVVKRRACVGLVRKLLGQQEDNLRQIMLPAGSPCERNVRLMKSSSTDSRAVGRPRVVPRTRCTPGRGSRRIPSSSSRKMKRSRTR